MVTFIRTPWGIAADKTELIEGVWRVATAKHGGLMLSDERWEALPEAVRETMHNANFAEEDCEEPIIPLILSLSKDGVSGSTSSP